MILNPLKTKDFKRMHVNKQRNIENLEQDDKILKENFPGH